MSTAALYLCSQTFFAILASFFGFPHNNVQRLSCLWRARGKDFNYSGMEWNLFGTLLNPVADTIHDFFPSIQRHRQRHRPENTRTVIARTLSIFIITHECLAKRITIDAFIREVVITICDIHAFPATCRPHVRAMNLFATN
jgi:hypothetical protein